jgi:hypothetical protein
MGVNDFLIQSCSTDAANTGAQQCVGTPGRDDRLWLVPKGTSITKTNALLEATWDTLFNAVKGVRGLPLKTIFNATFEDGEDTEEKGWSNKTDFADEGLDSVTYLLDLMSLYEAKQYRTLNGINWAAYIVSVTGNIKGWSDDGVNLKPFTMLSFRVKKRTKETGAILERVPIKITWADPKQWNDYPAIVAPAWNPNEIDGIKDINVSASLPTTSGVTLTLTGFDSVAHEGAVPGDFVIYNSSLVAQTIATATEGLPGVYALAATLAPGTYTSGLKTQPNATTKYFETPTLATFVVA